MHRQETNQITSYLCYSNKFVYLYFTHNNLVHQIQNIGKATPCHIVNAPVCVSRKTHIYPNTLTHTRIYIKNISI